MVGLFVDLHLSKAERSTFRDGNCFLIASKARAYFIRQMLLRAVADGSNRSSCNVLCDRRSSWYDLALHGLWFKTNPNMRQRLHVSWWHSEVSKSLAASLEPFVCYFGQYGSTWKSKMIYLCKISILIPWLPCLCRMAKAVSSTVELVNSVTSYSVYLFNFAMWALATKCIPIELVPCSDGWQQTWWQTIHMMLGLPICSSLQCK